MGNYTKIVEQFSPDEKNLVDMLYIPDNAKSNEYKAITQIYTARMLTDAVYEMIKSNEKLAKSNELHARSLNWATWGLFAATVVLVLVTIFR